MSSNIIILNSEAHWLGEQLSNQFPQHTFNTFTNEADAIKEAVDCDVLIALAPHISEQLLTAMPKLKWLHALTTGVDNLLSSKALGSDVILTNSNGFHGPQMSELAIMLMLGSLRDFPKMVQNQKQNVWERWPQALMHNKTACIVGLGAIAEGLANRLNAFGMNVVGVSNGRNEVAGFRKIYKREAMCEAASVSDFMIVLVPYSEKTHHIIDDAVLEAMPKKSILINLARGGCLDEVALSKHLKTESIGGAALDVFAQEPLPENSNLWDAPNLIITPHIGGMSDNYHEQVLPIIVENLKAWSSNADNLSDATLPSFINRGNS